MCLSDRDRQTEIDNSEIKENISEKQISIQTVVQTFCPARKCPNSLFAASAPPLWATSKINGDHYHSHAAQTLLVEEAV